MGSSVGTEIVAAVKKAAAWGTAVVCGAADGILILEHTMARAQAFDKDNSLNLFFSRNMDNDLITCEGDIPAYLRYDILTMLMAMGMGATGGAPVNQTDPTAYAQTLSLVDNIDDLFITWALNNNINIEEIPSLKITGFTIAGEIGKPLTIAFTCTGDDKVYDSVINTPVTMANVTYPETGNRVLFAQAEFLLNDQSDIALASPADVICPSNMELVFKRNMAGVYSTCNGLKIDEPSNTDQPELTLKMEFPRYTTNQNKLDWVNKVAKKIQIKFTGALISAVDNREMIFSFPHAEMTNAETAIERGILKEPLEFNLLSADAAPAGMTGITNPFEVDLVNTEDADVLA